MNVLRKLRSKEEGEPTLKKEKKAIVKEQIPESYHKMQY
jgi:hypothetical protein